MYTIKPILSVGSKVTWDHVINRTPWIKKCLYNVTSEEKQCIQGQPIPVADVSSSLEIEMEQCYNREVEKASAKQNKAPKEKPDATASPASQAPGQKTQSQREAIKLHLKKTAKGHTWTPVPPQDKGPKVGK